MTYSPTVPPRFSATAAVNLGFEASDINRACDWIFANEATSEFASSLSHQIFHGLTYAQWAAAIDAGNGVNRKRRRAAHAPAPASTSTEPVAPTAPPAPASPPALPVKNPRLKLSPSARTIARRAVTKSDAWADYARNRGINAADLSGDVLRDAADACGVDIKALLDAHAKAAMASGSAVFGQIGADGRVALPAAGNGQVDWAKVRAVSREVSKEEIAARLSPVTREVVVTYNAATGARKSLGDAPTHPKFPLLTRAVTCRDYSGNVLSTFLVGPTGTGKSHACRQIAKLLDLPFYFQSMASEAFDLVGYERVNGVQKITPFVTAFRDGGICLLDEVDRYDPKASIALNAALANGEIALDNGEVIKRHKDFICIASGNTFGFGGSSDFTAAEKMDLSTISRFQVRIDWHVDSETEDAISAAFADNPDAAAAWLGEVRAVRAAMERLDLPYIADQRCVEAGANLIAAGMPLQDVRDCTYLAPLAPEQRKAVADLTAGKLARITVTQPAA